MTLNWETWTVRRSGKISVEMLGRSLCTCHLIQQEGEDIESLMYCKLLGSKSRIRDYTHLGFVLFSSTVSEMFAAHSSGSQCVVVKGPVCHAGLDVP